MAVQMTRAEYEAKYGKPVAAAPIKMTRAEYDAKYGTKPSPPGITQRSPNAILGIGNSGIGSANLGQMVADSFHSGIQKASEGAAEARATDNPLKKGAAVLKFGAGVASAATAPLAPAFAPIGAGIDYLGKQIGSIPAVQKFAVSPAGERTSAIAEPLADAGIIAGTALGVRSIARNAPSLATVKKSLTPPPKAPPVPDKAVIAAYQKAIKPTISAKNTAGQNAAYNKNTVEAVKTITQNKPNLRFVTEDGALEVGRLPKSRAEFAEAVDQTKSVIYKQYDALAKQAGEQGVKLNTAAISKDLDAVITNEALQLSHPEAIRYAQDIKARYSAARLPDGSPMGNKVLDTQTAQNVIENYNAELKAFYRNPTYNQASKVAIDAAVVKNLRSELDRVISTATGAKYQSLRNQYAALKAVEADVLKSANRAARLNNKGLLDYTDIFSGGDIVNGLISLNPALFAKGIAQKGIASWFKVLNDPDRAISGMFGKVDNYFQRNLITPPTNAATTPQKIIANTTDPINSQGINSTLPYSPEVARLLKLLGEKPNNQ